MSFSILAREATIGLEYGLEEGIITADSDVAYEIHPDLWLGNQLDIQLSGAPENMLQRFGLYVKYDVPFDDALSFLVINDWDDLVLDYPNNITLRLEYDF